LPGQYRRNFAPDKPRNHWDLFGERRLHRYYFADDGGWEEERREFRDRSARDNAQQRAGSARDHVYGYGRSGVGVRAAAVRAARGPRGRLKPAAKLTQAGMPVQQP